LLDTLKSSTDESSKQIEEIDLNIKQSAEICERLQKYLADLVNDQSYLDKQRLSEDAMTKVNVRIATS
jgi:hypothetical protein